MGDASEPLMGTRIAVVCADTQALEDASRQLRHHGAMVFALAALGALLDLAPRCSAVVIFCDHFDDEAVLSIVHAPEFERCGPTLLFVTTRPASDWNPTREGHRPALVCSTSMWVAALLLPHAAGSWPELPFTD